MKRNQAHGTAKDVSGKVQEEAGKLAGIVILTYPDCHAQLINAFSD
ncbi:hypothetical protein [Nitrosospira sp. Is2]|nr:hypothetical protein [Nitrosospira sp. Is2]WON73969.1 hypothetical protein R5L00_00325 [Nitrosospira sp. Is2]